MKGKVEEIDTIQLFRFYCHDITAEESRRSQKRLGCFLVMIWWQYVHSGNLPARIFAREYAALNGQAMCMS